MNEKEIKHFLSSDKKGIIVSIILIALGMILIGVGGYVTKTNVVVEDYNKLLSNYTDEEGKYVSFTTYYMPYQFAENSLKHDKEKYYFLTGKNDKWCIARLTDETYNKIKKQYDEKKSVKYTVKGYIFKRSSDLAEIAINVLDEELDNNEVKMLNFDDYFGKTYIDETKTPDSGSGYVIELIGGAGLFIGAIILVVGLLSRSKTKKAIKDFGIDELKSELAKSGTIYYKKYSLCLTDKYVISNVSGLNILEYKDIIWMYKENRKQNYASTGWYVKAKTNVLEADLAYSLTNNAMLEEIMNQIQSKNGNILIGYTKENKEEYKRIIKHQS